MHVLLLKDPPATRPLESFSCFLQLSLVTLSKSGSAATKRGDEFFICPTCVCLHCLEPTLLSEAAGVLVDAAATQSSEQGLEVFRLSPRTGLTWAEVQGGTSRCLESPCLPRCPRMTLGMSASFSWFGITMGWH